MSIINIRRDVNSHCESRAQRCHAIPCHTIQYIAILQLVDSFIYSCLVGLTFSLSSLDKHTIIFIKCCLHFLLIFMKIVAVIAGTTVVVGSILLCVDLITMNVVQQSVAEQLFFSFPPQHRFDMSRKQCKIIIEIEQNGKFVNRLIRSYIWCHNYCAISSRHFHLFIDVNM